MATLFEAARRYIILNKKKQIKEGKGDPEIESVYFTGYTPAGEIILGLRKDAVLFVLYDSAADELSLSIDPNGFGSGLASEYSIEQF